MTVLFDQPLFDPAKMDFEDADTEFLAGTLPTASNDDVGGEQWRFGPELFGGIVRH